jgi:osmoprotectant transport system substrate-binding protein
VGLTDTYGLHFKSFTSLDDAGPITVAALRGGEVQVAELSSSDGTVVRDNFVALRDDKHLLNADYVIPVIRRSVDTGAVAAALDRLSARLTTDQLAELNIDVTVDHRAPATVARRWLEQAQLI